MRFPRLLLVLVVLCTATGAFAREPLGKKPPASKRPVDKAQLEMQAKRTALLATIKTQQKIIERYEVQNKSAQKPDPKRHVSAEEYEQARAKKAAAEAELDKLSR